MSSAPKRGAHEEGVHSSSSLMRPSEEEGNPSFPRMNYGAVQENRPGYLSRPQSHDGERRSPLNSAYKMPSSLTDTSYGSHPISGPEVRLESRDLKDVRENKGMEGIRDVKPEKESRMDESKEVKHEREGRNDSKGEVKVEKDMYGVGGSHSNWKEQHRLKKHPDVPSGGGSSGGGMAGFWMGPPQVRKYEGVKHGSTTFIRKETDEAMGENRVDLKGDKERKRKEGKHHDWPESDKDRSDYKSNVQVGSSDNIEMKEVMREEKEKPEERERDHVEREGKSGGEKEGYQNDKEMTFGSEQKKPSESWRNMEREATERRREREGDLEGERCEKRIKGLDKESDEGVGDADDREREAFGHGAAQRKRMLRPRSSPQIVNRDGRFKSRGQDGEG